jgi:hypothetical protein
MPFKNFLFVPLAVAVLSACTPTSQDGLSGVVISSSAIRTPYSMAISTEQARVGETSQRFEVRHGDCYDYDCDSDRRRVEYQQPNDASNRYVGRTVWYGWSIYLPRDFPDLHPTNTTLGQVQMHEWRSPMWALGARNGALTLYAVNTPEWMDDCRAAPLSSMRGRWTDIVVRADYVLEYTGSNIIEVWINGQRTCTWKRPVITQEMLDASSTDALRFKYGIYNSYISRWFQRNARRQVDAAAFVDLHEDSGLVIRSATNRPYDHDWGVELPTQVVFYDEVRVGFSREEVDLRLRLR